MRHFPSNPDSLKNDPVTLVDEEGTCWVLHRKRLDLRAVRRLVGGAAIPLVWGDMGGIGPRPTTAAERPGLWSLVKGAYKGPGGTWATGRYLAHEFRTGAGRRMVYVEDH
ncbi:hypothetical protein PV341_14355 [Streptomyces sp. PA03-1a]|nr:hypothetical protein [Streptomyces sp. PA03-1a]